jgi:hypothetical protein
MFSSWLNDRIEYGLNKTKHIVTIMKYKLEKEKDLIFSKKYTILEDVLNALGPVLAEVFQSMYSSIEWKEMKMIEEGNEEDFKRERLNQAINDVKMLNLKNNRVLEQFYTLPKIVFVSRVVLPIKKKE